MEENTENQLKKAEEIKKLLKKAEEINNQISIAETELADVEKKKIVNDTLIQQEMQKLKNEHNIDDVKVLDEKIIQLTSEIESDIKQYEDEFGKIII